MKNEWSSEPLKLDRLDNIDKSVIDILKHNIELHHDMEFLDSSKIYFFKSQQDKMSVMYEHKKIYDELCGQENVVFKQFSIYSKNLSHTNRYFLFENSEHASYTIKGCTYTEMHFVNIKEDDVDLSLFPVSFIRNEKIKYKFIELN